MDKLINFDGEFRRLRGQNLAGASRLPSGLGELLNRAQRERHRRQEDRRRELKAVIIQRRIRGWLCRTKLQRHLSNEVDQRLSACRKKVSPDDIKFIMIRLHVTYKNQIDNDPHFDEVVQKSLNLSELLLTLILKDKEEGEVWCWRLKVLLRGVLSSISRDDGSLPLDILPLKSSLMLDALEVFLSSEGKCSKPKLLKNLLQYLLRHNYLTILDRLFCRIHTKNELPLQVGDNAYEDRPQIATVVSLLLKPLILLEKDKNCSEYRSVVIKCLFRLLRDKTDKNQYTFATILHYLKTHNQAFLRQSLNILNTNPDLQSPAILYTCLNLDKDQQALRKQDQFQYFNLLSKLTRNLPSILNRKIYKDSCLVLSTHGSRTILYSDETRNYEVSVPESLIQMMEDSLVLLNSKIRSQKWMQLLKESIVKNNTEFLKDHSSCVMHIFLSVRCRFYEYQIITDLWSAEGWIRSLWLCLYSEHRHIPPHDPVPLITIIRQSASLTANEAADLLPLLSNFCTFLFFSLSFLTDEDFIKPDLITEKAIKPFRSEEIIFIGCTLKDVAMGLLSLGYPDRHTAVEHVVDRSPTSDIAFNSTIWNHTMSECCRLVKEIYYRLERLQLVNELEWFTCLWSLPETGLYGFVNLEDGLLIYPAFTPYNRHCVLTPSNQERIIGCHWSEKACKLLITLPFTIEFRKRYKMFWSVVQARRATFQNPAVHFMHLPHITVHIRRDFIYEDSFERISVDNVPELKMALRIKFTNSLRMEEVGVDGGGIFREFITDLLKTAFDPMRGFFILSQDNKLYPNPEVATVYRNFPSHYFFIGRMLGKAIIENILVDIPLADFFIAKIIDFQTLHPSQLYTLDKEVFKNIAAIRTSIEDYASLELDFTTSTNCFGVRRIIELKPNGSNIPVNEENVIEYIHLLANQKLHIDIQKQTRAFTKGLANVLSIHNLRMFTPNEIQIIISGERVPIDLDDLQRNAIYAGGFGPDHPNIVMFWRILMSFTPEEVCLTLKFVTSCTRPPLRGFSDLHPPFCIQRAEGFDNRLPTASTCMNILKLPIYRDEAIMRQRILYAIKSGCGFDLS